MAFVLTGCKHAIPRSGWASSIHNRVGKTSMCCVYCVIPYVIDHNWSPAAPVQ